MGGFLGIGGSSAKTDRKFQLTGMEGLQNLFNWALPKAEAGFSTGQAELDQAGDYWSKILSGNRTAVTQAVAPETNAVNAAADAAKRKFSSFGTARGGGTAATNQQIDDSARASVDNAILGARPEAARETAKIGSATTNDALNLLGMGGSAEGDVAELAMKSRGQSFAINQATQQQVGQVIEAVLSGAFA